jgi:pimeloyl-ACP methyl ester carboxylesterase
VAASGVRRRWPFFLAGLLAAVILAGLLPPVQARGKGLAVLAEAVGIDFPRPFAAEYERTDASLDGVTGHLYAPKDPSPAIVLLPGAAPMGKDDPRAIRLARSLARAGRTVFIPDLILYERRFEAEDIDRIVRSALALETHPATEGPVLLLGISYGGSFALIATADKRLSGHLVQVATFGAYWDLVGVIQAVTTGTSLVNGASIPWEGHPTARSVLEQAVVGLAPPEMQASLGDALSRDEPDELSPQARTVFELLRNEDPSRTRELAAGLPPQLGEFLQAFSPSSVEGLEAPVVAMHSTDDPAVPYGELVRLRRALPEARIVTVSTFRHVDPSSSAPGGWTSKMADAWDAWRFTSWILAAQE